MVRVDASRCSTKNAVHYTSLLLDYTARFIMPKLFSSRQNKVKQYTARSIKPHHFEAHQNTLTHYTARCSKIQYGSS